MALMKKPITTRFCGPRVQTRMLIFVVQSETATVGEKPEIESKLTITTTTLVLFIIDIVHAFLIGK